MTDPIVPTQSLADLCAQHWACVEELKRLGREKTSLLRQMQTVRPRVGVPIAFKVPGGTVTVEFDDYNPAYAFCLSKTALVPDDCMTPTPDRDKIAAALAEGREIPGIAEKVEYPVRPKYLFTADKEVSSG